MTKQIDIIDNIYMLDLELNAAKVFIETINDKMDFLDKMCLEAESQIHKAEKRCAELKKLLDSKD